MKAEFTVTADCTLTAAINAKYPSVGKRRLLALVKDRQVRVNGVRVGENVRVSVGDFVQAFLPDVGTPDVRVIYSDVNIVVADKPAHIETAALPVVLAENYGSLYPVHRLDVNTTGVVVLARNEKLKAVLEKAFREKRVKKKYAATVCGTPEKKEGTLVGWLVKDEKRGIVRIYDSPACGGVRCETGYKVLSRDGETSVLELYPKTGRTHQLRAQLAHAGCPVLGDGKYGDFKMNRKYSATRQLLRAVSVSFRGMTGELEYLGDKEFNAGYEEKVR